MSYASVAAHNAPPPSQQPHPDQGLLNTENPVTLGAVDENAKVQIVSSEPKETEIIVEDYDYEEDPKTKGRKKAKELKARARRDLDKAEEEGVHLWALAKEQILRPGVAGGLLGVVNVGLLGTATYHLYTKPHLQTNTRFLSTLAITSFAILGLEGFAADRYANTPRGQQEAKRAKAEGAAIYRHTKEVVLRPGVLGGIVGVVNLGVIGTVGYFAYTNWDAPRWDRKVVSAVSAGLIALWGGEGILAEKYHN